MLARRVGEEMGAEIDQSGIARIESGKRAVRLNEVQAICELLSMDLHVGRTTHKSQAEDYEAAHAEAVRKRDAIEKQFARTTMQAEELRNDLSKTEKRLQDLHVQRAETTAIVLHLERRLYELADARKRAEMREAGDGDR